RRAPGSGGRRAPSAGDAWVEHGLAGALAAARRTPRSSAANRRAVLRRRVPRRVGRPHALEPRGPVPSSQLPQRVGLAARQLLDLARSRTAWLRRGGAGAATPDRMVLPCDASLAGVRGRRGAG